MQRRGFYNCRFRTLNPEDTVKQTHESHMRWAIALALEGAGRTSPNPVVGALVVKGGRVVGEGYHARAGAPHAEINALAEAGRRARGADLYVTLEPCCHEGRTPPCVPSIVEAGIRRVIVGTRDPNPRVDGRGIRALKRAGVIVVEGVLKESCRLMNEPYNKFIKSGVPYVVAKVALSLDGKIAAASGESKWISNELCRAYVHRLRGQADAVMVGANTVLNDDPRLTVRLPGRRRQPLAVVVDETLRIRRNARLAKRAGGELIMATTSRASKTMRRFLEKRGHSIILCRATPDGRVFLPHLLKELGKIGVTSILLEGGGELFADFFRRGMVDRVVCCLAPKLIGGGGKDFLPGLSAPDIGSARALDGCTIEIMGDNVIIDGKPKMKKTRRKA